MFPTAFPGVSACFFRCFYGFLGCFFCFPSLLPLFPILDFAVETDMRRTLFRDILLDECNTAFPMLFSLFIFRRFQKHFSMTLKIYCFINLVYTIVIKTHSHSHVFLMTMFTLKSIRFYFLMAVYE